MEEGIGGCDNEKSNVLHEHSDKVGAVSEKLSAVVSAPPALQCRYPDGTLMMVRVDA